ncbi:ABC transporter ATP-binding protein [Pseudalkalibacillus caeni]|uniref:Quaternary amine transport ATP-binding protein n=1 Tax=Exobacillus caeni TaxID=2574798 RepID=A0A5R9F741_9BACL|nr:betaine/proline/choline family ABC transporter ATP-binding protein [Pseudalkalibacillus caeni]TLS38080.1 ATP-binding cassette domain-containing protein [Pseudalkalibacillus caeni]
MITFENVSKQYPDGTRALKNITLTVEEGELLTLIGPSGCGKTTTMKMVNRLIEPTEGKIYVDGNDISSIDPVELRRNIGYVIQQIGLLPHMTIAENVALIPNLKKWPKDKTQKRVDELLDLVGLDPSVFRDRYPLELSGGQQQRVGVIRALAAEPPVVLMDEPFSALDPISREQLQDELVKLQKEIKKTIVFVTHDMDEAIKIADRIAVMKDGEIVQLSDPETLLREPKNAFVQNFIGEERLESGKGPKASQLMFVKTAVVTETKGLAEAMKTLKDHLADTLLVIDESGNYKGVAFLEDIHNSYNEKNMKVKDVLKSDTPVVQPSAPYSFVAEIFAKTNVPSIPVVEKNKLVGLITKASMMRGLAGLKQVEMGKEEELNGE